MRIWAFWFFLSCSFVFLCDKTFPLTKKEKYKIQIYYMWFFDLWSPFQTAESSLEFITFPTDGFHSDVIKLYSQNSEVLQILIYTKLKITKNKSLLNLFFISVKF